MRSNTIFASSTLLLLLGIGIVAVVPIVASPATPKKAGAVVERFNELLHRFVEDQDAVKEVLAGDGEAAVGCFNGECSDDLHQMYMGNLAGDVDVFDYQTEYFTVTDDFVLMRCWNFFMCSSGCKAMFYADSLITVKDGRIDKTRSLRARRRIGQVGRLPTTDRDG